MLVRLAIDDQVSAHRDECPDAFRPEDRCSAGRPCSPVEASDGRLVDLQRVHEGDGIDGLRRLLSVPEGLVGKDTRGAEAATVRYDDPIA